MYEAYPNRDSTPYISEYNFDPKWKNQEFIRGTLRLNGWENAWADIFKMLDNKSPELNQQIDNLGEELWKKHPYLPDEQGLIAHPRIIEVPWLFWESSSLPGSHHRISRQR